jgi:hypothetical protein
LLEGGAAGASAVSIACMSTWREFSVSVSTLSIDCGTFQHNTYASLYLGGRSERARDDCLHLISRHGLIFSVPTFTALISFAWSTTVSYLTRACILVRFLVPTHTFVEFEFFSWVYREGIGMEGKAGLDCIPYKIYGWDYITCFSKRCGDGGLTTLGIFIYS